MTLPYPVEYAERWLCAAAYRHVEPYFSEMVATVEAKHFSTPMYAQAYALLRDSGNLPAEMVTHRLSELGIDMREFAEWHEANVYGLCNWTPFAEIVVDDWRRRELMVAAEQVVFSCRKGEPVDTLLPSSFELISRVCAVTKDKPEHHIGEAAKEVLAELYSKDAARILTGIATFDREYGGVHRRGITTILGVPGSGKTSFALQVATQYARTGAGVRIYSYEMSRVSVAANALGREAMVPVRSIQRSRREPNSYEHAELLDGIERLMGLDIRVVDEFMSAEKILNRARWDGEQGVRLYVIDYLQLLPPSGKHEGHEAIEHNMRCIRRIVRETPIGVLLLSQLTQQEARETRPPKASDGRGSATIREASDMMLGLYRPAINEGSGDQSICELHVLKDKYGPTGYVKIEFDQATTSFYDEGWRT